MSAKLAAQGAPLSTNGCGAAGNFTDGFTKEAPAGPQEAQKEATRGPQTAPKKPQNCLQEAPERPTTRFQLTLKRPLTHNRGTVAGWAEGHEIRRLLCLPRVLSVPGLWSLFGPSSGLRPIPPATWADPEIQTTRLQDD